MNWAQQQRQDFILKYVVEHGFINRSDITRFFRVGAITAGKDIAAWRRLNPEIIVYNKRAKRYEDPIRLMTKEVRRDLAQEVEHG